MCQWKKMQCLLIKPLTTGQAKSSTSCFEFDRSPNLPSPVYKLCFHLTSSFPFVVMIHGNFYNMSKYNTINIQHANQLRISAVKFVLIYLTTCVRFVHTLVLGISVIAKAAPWVGLLVCKIVYGVISPPGMVRRMKWKDILPSWKNVVGNLYSVVWSWESDALFCCTDLQYCNIYTLWYSHQAQRLRETTSSAMQLYRHPRGATAIYQVYASKQD